MSTDAGANLLEELRCATGQGVELLLGVPGDSGCLSTNRLRGRVPNLGAPLSLRHEPCRGEHVLRLHHESGADGALGGRRDGTADALGYLGTLTMPAAMPAERADGYSPRARASAMSG